MQTLIAMLRLMLPKAGSVSQAPPRPQQRLILARARPVAGYPPYLPGRPHFCLSGAEERLVVYGTLAPGGEYAHLLADLPGVWRLCTICGHMGTYRRYKTFRWNPLGQVHQAWMFTSPALPARFAVLDRFEGRAYQRRLIPAQAGSCLVIANIYEGKTWA